MEEAATVVDGSTDGILAEAAATRATCLQAAQGAVLYDVDTYLQPLQEGTSIRFQRETLVPFADMLRRHDDPCRLQWVMHWRMLPPLDAFRPDLLTHLRMEFPCPIEKPAFMFGDEVYGCGRPVPPSHCGAVITQPAPHIIDMDMRHDPLPSYLPWWWRPVFIASAPQAEPVLAADVRVSYEAILVPIPLYATIRKTRAYTWGRILLLFEGNYERTVNEVRARGILDAHLRHDHCNCHLNRVSKCARTHTR